MNPIEALEKKVSFLSGFKWTPKRESVALDLASGLTIEKTAKKNAINERTIYRWKTHPDFEAEINRLSLMVGIANRAERLRIAMRIVESLGEETNRDLLDWLKYAQSETDGVKLDLTALLEAVGPVADGRQDRVLEEESAETGQLGASETPGV